MKAVLSACTLVMFIALFPVDASAQGVNLNGRWQCVAACFGAPGGIAFITQNGWELNVLNDVGVPSRAWIDYPGHIWIDRFNQGALYSPDGFTLQFDRGTVWQRVAEIPLPPPPYFRR